MALFLKNWTPVKDSTNKRVIKVFSQFDLSSQAASLRAIKNLASSNEAIVEYDIKTGSITGLKYEKAEIALHMDWDQLPGDHKITIKTYASDTLSDDQSLNTGDAPTW